MKDAQKMSAEAYTANCQSLVESAVGLLRTVSTMMKERGDETRAMDLDEAIAYAEAAVDDS